MEGTKRTPARNLGDFLDHEVVPHLSVEDVFTDPTHAWKERGKKWKGGCPWHGSKSGTSFTVDPESLRWFCAGGCGGGGPVQYLWRLRGGAGTTPGGVDFVELLKELAQKAGVPFPERELSEEEKVAARAREARRSALDVVISRAEEVLWSPAGEEARNYLTTGRGFTEPEIRSLRLGFYDSTDAFRAALVKAGVETKDAVDAVVLWSKLEGFVLVPWLDERGRPLTLYGRWKAKTPPLQKDHPAWKADRDKAHAEWEARKKSGVAVAPWTEPEVPKTTALPGEGTKGSPLYFDRARSAGEKELVLVEGVFDAALLQVRGDSRVVASVGAQASKLQVETLVRNRVKSVFICGDPDPGGDAGTLHNIRNLSAAGLSTFVVPRLPDNLDPDDFVRRDGIEAWKKLVLESVSGPVFNATHLLEGVTPTSPEKEKKEAVERVLPALEDLTGDHAPLDEELVLHELEARTGFTAGALAEVWNAQKERKARVALADALQKAGKDLGGGDVDPGSIVLDISKKLSSLQVAAEPDPRVFSVTRVWDEMGETPTGRRSGWNALDALDVRFHAGELSLVAARTGHAKTTVLVGLLWNWLQDAREDETFLFYSHEEAEVPVARRLLALASMEVAGGRPAWSRSDIRAFRADEGSRTDWPSPRFLHEAKELLARFEDRLFIVHRSGWTADQVAAHALSVMEKGRTIGGVFVDYLQRIPVASKGKGDRRDIDVSAVARRLKTLSEELECPVVAGAQVNRDSIPDKFSQKVAEAEDYKAATAIIRTARPDLHNLREGGSEQEADFVLGLLNYAADYRTEAKAKDTPAVTLLEMGALKNRDGESGRWTGLAFEGRYGLVRDMRPDEVDALRPEEAPSMGDYFRERESGLNQRSVDRHEREKLKLQAKEREAETARVKLETERLKTERATARKTSKTEEK